MGKQINTITASSSLKTNFFPGVQIHNMIRSSRGRNTCNTRTQIFVLELKIFIVILCRTYYKYWMHAMTQSTVRSPMPASWHPVGLRHSVVHKTDLALASRKPGRCRKTLEAKLTHDRHAERHEDACNGTCATKYWTRKHCFCRATVCTSMAATNLYANIIAVFCIFVIKHVR